MFVIGCYTGLGHSDLSRLQPQHIEDGMITIKQQKTGEVVIIPLVNKVISILEKYGNTLLKISNQKYNSTCMKSVKSATYWRKK